MRMGQHSKKDGEKIHKCMICDKTYTTLTNLNTHIDTVHKGKRYPCSSCDYESTQKGHLKEHVMSKHDGIVFNCKTCDEQYTTKGGLRSHSKRCKGTSVKKENAVRRKPRINRNRRQKVRVEPEKCSDCDKRNPKF